MAAQKIMLIRHGEKEDASPPFCVNGDGIHDKHSLSVRGWQRAGALVPFFGRPWATGIATPSMLYGSRAASEGVRVAGEDLTKSLRPQQTLTPLSAALGIPINTDWSVGEEPHLVAAIKNATGVVLVAWEHRHIPLIARALSSDAPDRWPHGDRFDLVWVLDTIVGSGLYSFREIHQNLLAGDAR
jgi:broad specificity phosphatase PhoE